MANNYFNKQIQTLTPSTGEGRKPLASGSREVGMPVRTASWPGLPGKSGPDRSAGVPEEKIYAMAQGLAGGKDDEDM